MWAVGGFSRSGSSTLSAFGAAEHALLLLEREAVESVQVVHPLLLTFPDCDPCDRGTRFPVRLASRATEARACRSRVGASNRTWAFLSASRARGPPRRP